MSSYNNDEPVVAVNCNLQDTDGDQVDITQFEYTTVGSYPGGWQSATLHSSTPGTGLATDVGAPGRNTVLRWDVDADTSINASGYLRIKVEDVNTDESSLVETGPFWFQAAKPSVTYSFANDYTNTRFLVDFPISASGLVTRVKTGEVSDLTGSTWVAGDGTVASITFATSAEEAKTCYLQVADQYYNKSTIVSDSIILHKTPPADTWMQINGSANNEWYTGIDIQADGSFVVDLGVTVNLYAEDALDIEIYVDGDIEDGANVRTWIPYTTELNLTMTGDEYNYDNTGSITVIFRDEAENETIESRDIRVNTKVLTTSNNNLRDQTPEYVHQVLEVTGQGTTNPVSETEYLSGDFVRPWLEIFYPETHDYPRLPNGDIDEASCIALNETSNASYDAVDLDGGTINYDSEGRPVTIDWTKDGSKDYLNAESSYAGNLRYWVIDNTGYGDIDLSFEHFYLDPNSYGPPYNGLAPHTGDCLVIYDASDPGATQAITGKYGRTDYTLLDSTKLTELYSYTGKGNQVIEQNSGYSVNASVNGAFNVPTIRGINRVCLILYTDASNTSSGFKLKASDKYEKVWRNWDVDELNGEVWFHKYPTGAAYTGELRMIYDYYDKKVTIDHDKGQVTFESDPSGVVTADYSYYIKNPTASDKSRQFMLFNDDLVAYVDEAIYATPSGQSIDKTATYVHGYPTPVSASGKITANYSIDKDRAIVEFFDGTADHGDEFAFVPSGRLTADYQYHTYTRLTNDGFGDFFFRDSTIVADDTPLYPDYTWADVKIVNEGDAVLEEGKIKFLPRGYDNDSDGNVDQVLDINRPWDIQKGSAAETYDKCAMEPRSNYTFDVFASKSSCTSILSSWKNANFGFDVYPRTRFYGRIVWVVGGTSGSSYPSTTTGEKRWSAEVEGKFYSVEL